VIGTRWRAQNGAGVFWSALNDWMQREMNEHEKIEKALRVRLSELRTRLVKVDRELHKPLPADSEDRAIELENQEALEGIGKTEISEIHRIESALKHTGVASSVEAVSIRGA
jgi:hypothetical protein